MNILIEPIYIGFFQVLISSLIISGLIFSGRYINHHIFNIYQNNLLDLIIGLIFLSQILKIIVYLGYFDKFFLIFSYFFVIAGLYNLKNFFISFPIENYFKKLSKIEIIIILTLFLFFLISVAPPTMADALDYHYGIPFYLLKFNQLPSINFWLYGNVGGNGEIFNSLALYLGTDNFVSIVQVVSLILFLLFLSKEIKNKNKFIFLSIFILSSPTILQLLSGPKFMILPQIMTALALYFLVKNKKIKVIDFIFISILLMGAAQFKSSFIISGFLIGLITFLKAFKINAFKTLLFSFIISCFFFLPTAIYNFNQIENFNLINIFSIMPNEMFDNMRSFKENDFIYPLNIFFPSSFGKISTLLGFQIFLLIFFLNKSKKFNLVLFIIFFTIILHYFLGMNIARMYYEYILWGSIGFIFIKDKKINYNLFAKLILPQTILIICFASYFSFTSFPSLFSNNARNDFMIKNTFFYEGAKWANESLPKNSKILSTIRPVSLLKNEFAPTDWLDFYSNESQIKKYIEILKKMQLEYILMVDSPKNHILNECIGKKVKQSKNLQRGSRNPFNRNNQNQFSIYHFNYHLLPGCFVN